MPIDAGIYQSVQPLPSPVKTMQEMATLRNQQLAQQIAQQRLQMEQQEYADKQKAAQAKGRLSAIMTRYMRKDGSIDTEALIGDSDFKDSPYALEAINDLNDFETKRQAAITAHNKNDAEADALDRSLAFDTGIRAQDLIDAGNYEDAAGMMSAKIAAIHHGKLMTKEEGEHFIGMLDPSNPQSIQQVANILKDADPKARQAYDTAKLAQEHQRQVNTGTVPVTPDQAADNARQQAQIDEQAKRDAETRRHNLAMEKRPVAGGVAGAGVKSTLSDETLNQAADKYFETGVLPSLGMGTAAAIDKRAIMERAGERHPGGALAFNAANYKANAATLSKLRQQNAALKAFETTGLKNLENFTTLAKDIPDTGVPWLNSPVRTLTQNLVGSTNMPAVNAAREVALTEIARIVSNPNLTGVLSDSAREEVRGLIPANATFKQIKRVAEVLQQDMANRRTSMDEQIADIEGRLRGTPAVTPDQSAAPAPKTPTLRFNPATGKVEPIQ